MKNGVVGVSPTLFPSLYVREAHGGRMRKTGVWGRPPHFLDSHMCANVGNAYGELV